MGSSTGSSGWSVRATIPDYIPTPVRLPRPVRPTALAAALLLALPRAAPAAEPPLDLRLDVPATLGVTGAALGLDLATVLLQKELTPTTCRICGAGRFDTSVRDALRWKDTGAASTASDILGIGTPALAAGALALAGLSAGGARTAAEDLLITGEAVSVAILATQIAKFSFGRLRPDAWAAPGASQGPSARVSLWSGHTGAAFAAAVAAGTVARLRGYRSWPWILGLGLAGAAATGWLRIAADRHWATDVLAGAAAGSAVGYGLPVWLHGRREGDRATGLRLEILPNGLAGTF